MSLRLLPALLVIVLGLVAAVFLSSQVVMSPAENSVPLEKTGVVTTAPDGLQSDESTTSLEIETTKSSYTVNELFSLNVLVPNNNSFFIESCNGIQLEKWDDSTQQWVSSLFNADCKPSHDRSYLVEQRILEPSPYFPNSFFKDGKIGFKMWFTKYFTEEGKYRAKMTYSYICPPPAFSLGLSGCENSFTRYSNEFTVVGLPSKVRVSIDSILYPARIDVVIRNNGPGFVSYISGCGIPLGFEVQSGEGWLPYAGKAVQTGGCGGGFSTQPIKENEEKNLTLTNSLFENGTYRASFKYLDDCTNSPDEQMLVIRCQTSYIAYSDPFAINS